MIVYTDGSRIPGQDNRGYAGIGIWFGEEDPRNTSMSIHEPGSTNQYAELLAIYYALQFCKDIQDLIVRSDSNYSIKCITTWSNTWKVNGWKTSKGDDVVNLNLIKSILDIILYRNESRYSTRFEHVYGHKGDQGNEAADKLATSASLKQERYVMDNTIYFYSHNIGEYMCFSQFYPSIFEMEYDGEKITYNCTEQHHHQQKAIMFNDYESALKIMDTSSPSQQKKLGRHVKGFDQSIWLQSCYEICKRANIAKFSQNKDLLVVLMSTKGKWIAEASPDDIVWGIGISASQSKARVKWRGQNLLGKVLVDIRDNYFSSKVW